MSIVNLESALRTCKTDSANAERILSDRFLNPQNMVCPVWNGLDAAGRIACVDSFKTKREGCNSAQDRVGVENIQRPQYMQYISARLDANYNKNSSIPPRPVVAEGYEQMEYQVPPKQFSDLTGSTGLQLDGIVWPRTCGTNTYDKYSKSVL